MTQLINRLRTNGFMANVYSYFGYNKLKNKGRGNEVLWKRTFRKHCHINIHGNNNKIIFEPSRFSIKNISIEIRGDNNIISIGRDFATDGMRFSIEDNDNRISIGKRCHGGGNSELAAIEGTEIYPGDDCMLSANITIRTGDSHSVIDALSGLRLNPSKSVMIGDHVWIGNTVLIFKGTSISAGCIVAGGSVVTGKTFTPNCIIGGNPAKVIKENINWCSERI